MRSVDHAFGPVHHRFRFVPVPRPCVSEPERWKQMESSSFGTSIVYSYANQNVVRSSLRIFEKHVEVSIVVEDPCVEQLVFELMTRTPRIRFHNIAVRVLPLRILVEVLHVIVRGSRV